MAYLEIIEKNDNSKSQSNLYKRLTSIGSSDGADIIIDNEKVADIACYISHNAEGFSLILADDQSVFLNQRPIEKQHLKNGDEFDLCGTRILFCDGEAVSADDEISKISSPEVIAYRRMLDFSHRIAKEKDIDALLHTLLNEITQLIDAEYGFLVLLEDNKPVVKVRAPKDLDEKLNYRPISDSMVKKVIEQKDAIIVNDAINDEEFCSSLSVINYRLISVMCAPLIYQGQIIGVIYVGNNSFVSAFNQKNLELMTIYSSQAAILVKNALYISGLKQRAKSLQETLEQTKFGGLIGGCQSMQAVFRQVDKIATSDVCALIIGESGTGKEMIARELHQRSRRKDHPFVVINCSAIPSDALESELFGHVRGAFSGAIHSRSGKLLAANQGTLLLDEVSEIPLHLQAKLLQALREQVVTKIGDSKNDAIDIRILATTTDDLLAMVKSGDFREDLYYHLNVVQISVPPLKDRGNDVLVMANFFLQKYAKIYGKSIIGLDESGQNALLRFHWPGNVRQLENRMRRAIVMCDHARITAKDLDIDIASTKIMPLADALENFRYRYIAESLEKNGGNRTKTASELGVDPRTIFRHLEGKKKTRGSITTGKDHAQAH